MTKSTNNKAPFEKLLPLGCIMAFISIPLMLVLSFLSDTYKPPNFSLYPYSFDEDYNWFVDLMAWVDHPGFDTILATGTVFFLCPFAIIFYANILYKLFRKLFRSSRPTPSRPWIKALYILTFLGLPVLLIVSLIAMAMTTARDTKKIIHSDYIASENLMKNEKDFHHRSSYGRYDFGDASISIGWSGFAISPVGDFGLELSFFDIDPSVKSLRIRSIKIASDQGKSYEMGTLSYLDPEKSPQYRRVEKETSLPTPNLLQDRMAPIFGPSFRFDHVNGEIIYMDVEIEVDTGTGPTIKTIKTEWIPIRILDLPASSIV